MELRKRGNQATIDLGNNRGESGEPHQARRTVEVREGPESQSVVSNDAADDQQMPGRPNCLVPRDDLKSMSTRDYLNATVAPVLFAGLQALSRERPEDPHKFMAAFILKNRPNPPTS